MDTTRDNLLHQSLHRPKRIRHLGQMPPKTCRRLPTQALNDNGRYRQHRTESRAPYTSQAASPVSGTLLRFADYALMWIGFRIADHPENWLNDSGQERVAANLD